MTTIFTGKYTVAVTPEAKAAAGQVMMTYAVNTKITFRVLPWGFQIIAERNHPCLIASITIVKDGKDPLLELWKQADDWLVAHSGKLDKGF